MVGSLRWAIELSPRLYASAGVFGDRTPVLSAAETYLTERSARRALRKVESDGQFDNPRILPVTVTIEIDKGASRR